MTREEANNLAKEAQLIADEKIRDSLVFEISKITKAAKEGRYEVEIGKLSMEQWDYLSRQGFTLTYDEHTWITTVKWD